MRLDYRNIYPEALRAMGELEKTVHASPLEPELLELVKIRASQLNGCGYCLDMHTKDAAVLGISDQRMHLVAAWREAPCYSARGRVALAWCEALTLLPTTGAPDEIYEQVAAVFTPEETVALTLAVIAINGWNRFAVGFQATVGSYQPSTKAPA